MINMKKAVFAAVLAAAAAVLTACTADTETVQDTSGAVITFAEESVTGSGTGWQAEGTAVTIDSSGTYTVSGNCSDGTIKIKKGVEDVTLVLDGLTLESGDTAPITCGKSSTVTIVAREGTVNSLSDTEYNNDDEYPENTSAENAVIKCKDGSNVTISGTGTLNITAKGKNGIKSGTADDETGSSASLTVDGPEINISAPVNDGINAESLLSILNGSVTVAAGDDGIHCDYELNIGAEGTDGPEINITECYEGMEGANLNIYSGDITITASDDCLNAANGDLAGYDFTLDIAGGTLNMYTTDGDGIDSNGTLDISGGTVIVWTANRADNQPLDADGEITITGGTVLAGGGSTGMGMNLETTQPYVLFGGSMFSGGPGESGGLTVEQGAIEIRDASGSAAYSGEAPCAGMYVFFSSGQLKSGESYELVSNGEFLAAAEASTESLAGAFSGGFGAPGGMGTPPDMGERPADAAPPDMGELPENGTPPEKPEGGTPPEMGSAPPEPPAASE